MTAITYGRFVILRRGKAERVLKFFYLQHTIHTNLRFFASLSTGAVTYPTPPYIRLQVQARATSNNNTPIHLDNESEARIAVDSTSTGR
jgi:hypothetical protein